MSGRTRRRMACALALGLLLILVSPATHEAPCAPKEESKHWTEMVNVVGDRAGITKDVAGLALDADSAWLGRASAAFVGWKIGGLLAAEKYYEACVLFAKFSAENFIVGLSPAAPFYTALNLWVTAMKSARRHLANYMYARLWRMYVQRRTGQDKFWHGEDDWVRKEDTLWSTMIMKGYEDFARQWGPTGRDRLKLHFRERFAAEYGRDLKPIPFAADADRELTRLAQEMKEKVFRLQAVAVSDVDHSVLPDARVQGEGPNLEPAGSGALGMAEFDVWLKDIGPGDKYTFEAHCRGKQVSSILPARWLVARMLSTGRDVLPCHLRMAVEPQIPTPPEWPLGTEERRVLFEQTGHFKGGHFGLDDKRWPEHEARAVRGFDAGTLDAPGKAHAQVVVNSKGGVPIGEAYAKGRDPTTSLGVTLPGESKVRWGLNVPSTPWPKGTRVRVLVEQDWRNASNDAVFFPCAWRLRVFFLPKGGVPPGVGHVTDVTSRPKPKPRPRRGFLLFEARGPRHLLADGTSTCEFRAHWVTLDGSPAGVREIRISKPRIGHVRPAGSVRTDEWGWATFVYTAPTAEVFRSVAEALGGKDVTSGRLGLTAMDVRSGGSRRVRFRVSLPAEGR